MRKKNDSASRTVWAFLTVLIALFAFSSMINAQTAAFTYQGKLADGGNSMPTATYDMKFDLYDADVDGSLIGSVTNAAVFVNSGVFTTSLNFGAAAFDGGTRYLEISIRPAGSGAAYTKLQPRQRISSTPYATQSNKATTAQNFSGSLSGDVTGTQTATVVSTVGGQTAANVASAAQIANAATSANTPEAVVKRDATGSFAASNVIAGNVTLASGGKVTFADGTQQATSVDPSLFVVRNTQSGSVLVTDTRLTVQTGATDGPTFQVNSPETNSTVRGGVIARFRSGSPLGDRFRFDQAGGFVALGTLGYGIVPATGAGERMMWHPYKAAFRAGSIGSGGTQWDDASVGFYTWAGGYNTTALGLSSFAMGYQSEALGSYSNALGYSSIADGTGSIAIGYRSSAIGDYSVALGQRARAGCNTGDTICTTPFARTGAIVIADASTTAFVDASANNQFSVRAAGGYRLFSNATLTTGVTLSAGGGAWATLSDRNAKENFGAVNSRDVLKKVLQLPISTWSYKGQTYRHIGAMAQDFYKVFDVGENDKTITTVDPDGVAFAAIQGLNEEMKESAAKLKAENTRLTAQLATQNQKLARQQSQLDEFEARLKRVEQSSRKTHRTIKRQK